MPESPLAGEAAGARDAHSTVVRRAALALLTLAVTTLALVSRADAFLYWGDPGNNIVGRANLDGSSANQSFVAAIFAEGVAVDGAHVYWADYLNGLIGRANINGSAPNQSFIDTGGNAPAGVAVDGSHVYWTNNFAIGRAALDGGSANQGFVAAIFPNAVAVDAGHIYWTNDQTNSGSIGRANLDGTGVDQNFIPVATVPAGVAVDGTYVYWTTQNPTTGMIGRANLNGTGVEQSFITFPAAGPFGLAVNATHIYWANSVIGTIGRANIDGSSANERFMDVNFGPQGSAPVGVAIDCGGRAATTDAIGQGDCDGNACTIADACVAGKCQPGNPLTAGVLSSAIREQRNHVAAVDCAADKKKSVKKVLAAHSKTAHLLRTAFRTAKSNRARKKTAAARRSNQRAAKRLSKVQSRLSAACASALGATVESARQGLACLP